MKTKIFWILFVLMMIMPLLGALPVRATLSDESIRVIVLFTHSPAEVQALQATDVDRPLVRATAPFLVEADHVLFRKELAQMFGSGNFVSLNTPYRIYHEYRHAINGVSMTLPANRVDELLLFQSVSAVFPDARVQLVLPEVPVGELFSLQSANNPYGMRPGRTVMRANDMHEEGFRGEGVLIAVIDTGIDYTHPSFTGAFPTLEQMRVRNPLVTAEDTINGIFYGRNTVHDDIPRNNPMESLPETGGATFHGTHVAGTIAGRDNNRFNTILGVAPEAQIIAYRVLGPGGEGFESNILAAIEMVVFDQPDVVNMSLGRRERNTPVCVIELAIGNVMRMHPNINFVLAAGNTTDPSYYMLQCPAPTEMAITVGAAHHRLMPGGNFSTELAVFSARGPVFHNHAIKPDIIGHGQNVWSAMPPWAAQFNGYGYLSGTSMATPHVAGAVALLVQYSRLHGYGWSNTEIKLRLMNNAMPMEGYSVFSVGAGYVNVWDAVGSDIVATGSVSFGGQARHEVGQVLNSYITIINLSTDARPLSISHSFTGNPYDIAFLDFSQTQLSLSAYNDVSILVDMYFDSYPVYGFYEGHIYIYEFDRQVARIPFAFVVYEGNDPWNGWNEGGTAYYIDGVRAIGFHYIVVNGIRHRFRFDTDGHLLTGLSETGPAGFGLNNYVFATDDIHVPVTDVQPLGSLVIGDVILNGLTYHFIEEAFTLHRGFHEYRYFHTEFGNMITGVIQLNTKLNMDARVARDRGLQLPEHAEYTNFYYFGPDGRQVVNGWVASPWGDIGLYARWAWGEGDSRLLTNAGLEIGGMFWWFNEGSLAIPFDHPSLVSTSGGNHE